VIDPLQSSIRVAGSALQAQSMRIRVVSENLANAQTTGAAPGDDPYSRKTVSFANEMSRVDQANLVTIRKVGVDQSAFRIVRDPGHPAADARGYVKMPNGPQGGESIIRGQSADDQAGAGPVFDDCRPPEIVTP
jgi:flagellar basal-body rod protein FlgC